MKSKRALPPSFKAHEFKSKSGSKPGAMKKAMKADMKSDKGIAKKYGVKAQG